MSEFWQFVATLVAAGVGFYGALKAIKYQADLTRYRDDRLAADTLRADLERIDAILGDSANRFGAVVRGMTFEPPQLHRWSETVIARLASADRNIVADAMELERDLHNFAVLVSRLHGLRVESDEARQALRRERELRDSGEGPFGPVQMAAKLLNAEFRVERASDAVREEIQAMQRQHAAARARIATLLGRLAGISRRPEPPILEAIDDMRVQSWSGTAGSISPARQHGTPDEVAERPPSGA